MVRGTIIRKYNCLRTTNTIRKDHVEIFTYIYDIMIEILNVLIYNNIEL